VAGLSHRASTAARGKAAGVGRDLGGRALLARGACPWARAAVVHAARALHKEPLGSRSLYLLGTGAPWLVATSIKIQVSVRLVLAFSPLPIYLSHHSGASAVRHQRSLTFKQVRPLLDAK
jgi:hypothetical protein